VRPALGVHHHVRDEGVVTRLVEAQLHEATLGRAGTWEGRGSRGAGVEHPQPQPFPDPGRLQGVPAIGELMRERAVLLNALAEHIEREDLGIFPVSAVTLGRDGWAIVDQAHEDEPTFLKDGGS